MTTNHSPRPHTFERFRNISVAVVVCALAFAVKGTPVAQGNPPQNERPIAEARQTFENRCAGCHGANGTGGEIGPNIADADADTLIDSMRSGSAPQGLSGAPADRRAGDAALRETLLRVSRLTDDLPEIAELDLSPVIAGEDGAVVVDARIRVAPPLPQDPFLRKLRLRQAPFIWRSVSMSSRPG